MERSQDDNSKVIIDSIKQLLEDNDFYKVFSHAAILMKPGLGKCFFLFLLGFYFLSYLYFNPSEDIACNISKIIDISNTINLALLAMVITGYAIFQAIISNEALITLLSQHDNNNNLSLFLSYQYFFFILATLYLVIIAMNLFLTFILSIYPKVVSTIPINYIDFLVTIYLLVNILSIIEFKSFIYNLYQAISLTTICKTMVRCIMKLNS